MSTIRLYTEAQVKSIADHAIKYGYWQEPENVIELPSEDEIVKYANFAMPDAEKIGGETYTAFKGFELGAKWMRDKIKGDK